jgi:hypothetical protein
MVTLAGVGRSKVLVSLSVLFTPLPQAERYFTLTLSSVAAAFPLVKLTLITCEFTVPESIWAFEPKVPVKDHNHPVASEVAEVTASKAGAA